MEKIKKQSKRRFVEDNLHSQQPEVLTCQGGRESADRNNISSGYLGTGKPKEYLLADIKRDKFVIKLMEMAKEVGIIEERKRIIKLFKFELDNRVTGYNTLEKLDKINKEIEK